MNSGVAPSSSTNDTELEQLLCCCALSLVAGKINVESCSSQVPLWSLGKVLQTWLMCQQVFRNCVLSFPNQNWIGTWVPLWSLGIALQTWLMFVVSCFIIAETAPTWQIKFINFKFLFPFFYSTLKNLSTTFANLTLCLF